MRENVRSIDGFRFIDLFAGIGGFHLALQSLGGTCILASEIDAASQSAYRANFPQTPLVGDVRELTRRPRSIPSHDVLAAGFPCQPFSKSGYQLGLRDRTRGTLFFEIMEVVRARRPRFVVLENVRNIAGPRHRETWSIVIESLREEGYAVASEPVVFSPHLLPPQLGGAPQVRDRVFVLAEYVGRSRDREREPIIRNEPVAGWSTRNWRIDDYLDDEPLSNAARYRIREDEELWLSAWNDFIQRLPRQQLPGFPIWVDAFRRRPDTGPDVPDWKANFHVKNSALYLDNKDWIDAWIRRWGVKGFPPSRRKFEWQAKGHEPDVWKLVIHFRPSGIRVKPPTYLPALVAITQTSVIGSRRRRITPREAARLQSFPDHFLLHPNDAVAYRQLGNAVNVGVARFVAEALLTGEDRTRYWQEQLRLVS